MPSEILFDSLTGVRFASPVSAKGGRPSLHVNETCRQALHHLSAAETLLHDAATTVGFTEDGYSRVRTRIFGLSNVVNACVRRSDEEVLSPSTGESRYFPADRSHVLTQRAALAVSASVAGLRAAGKACKIAGLAEAELAISEAISALGPVRKNVSKSAKAFRQRIDSEGW